MEASNGQRLAVLKTVKRESVWGLDSLSLRKFSSYWVIGY
jgi:hypothetical protein